MADVKWIKIVTDIFDDEKILLIESLPEADGIIVIWFKLLCLAGKQNNDGVFKMSNGIPYTEAMLASIFRRKESTVKLALKTFEQFGMVEIINSTLTIPNWNKHQSLDSYEKRKERDRIYQSERRERQRLLAESTDASTDASSDVGFSEVEVDKDIDKNTISPDLQSGIATSIDDVFNKTYAIYPRKEGKAKGKANYINYLTKGRSISGQGRIKLNHQQIYIAVQAYAAAVCGTETRYIKNFEAFTNSTLLDYIEQTQEAYEAWMFEKYGNDWKGVKFTYH